MKAPIGFDPQKHHRQSHRLKGYDYAFSAPYYVTLCTQNYLCLFGKVKDEQMVLNHKGKMVEYWLNELQHKFPDVLLDDFVVMPNHVHAIIVLMAAVWMWLPDSGSESRTWILKQRIRIAARRNL